MVRERLLRAGSLPGLLILGPPGGGLDKLLRCTIGVRRLVLGIDWRLWGHRFLLRGNGLVFRNNVASDLLQSFLPLRISDLLDGRDRLCLTDASVGAALLGLDDAAIKACVLDEVHAGLVDDVALVGADGLQSE